MIEQLVKCFKDSDETIRELASRGIMQVACVERGREYIVKHWIVTDVAALFEDQVVKIRSNAYHTLLRLADFLYGIDSTIDFDLNII